MDDLLEVKAVLANGDTVAIPTGTMCSIFRVVHDEVKGETSFVYEALANLTGSHNTVRIWKYAHSAGASADG